MMEKVEDEEEVEEEEVIQEIDHALNVDRKAICQENVLMKIKDNLTRDRGEMMVVQTEDMIIMIKAHQIMINGMLHHQTKGHLITMKVNGVLAIMITTIMIIIM